MDEERPPPTPPAQPWNPPPVWPVDQPTESWVTPPPEEPRAFIPYTSYGGPPSLRESHPSYGESAVGGTPYASYGPPSDQPLPERGTSRAAKIGGGLAAATGIGKLVWGLKGLAMLAKLKSLGSMLLSLGAYTLVWGWKYALGFVILLFLHEVGHVVVLRAQGVKASLPMFIPMLGAVITVEEEQKSVTEEALSAIAGPVLGLIAAGATFAASAALDSNLLQALAYTGFLLNLFNLIPMLPLDGGRVAGAVHPALWWLGLATAVVLLFVIPSPVVVLVLIFGLIELVHRWRNRKSPEDSVYLSVPARTRWQFGAAYLILVAICLVGMDAAYVPDPHAAR